MDFTTLKLETRNEVLYCGLNRPEKRNALNKVMLKELVALFKSIEDKPGIRVFVIKGEGKIFSAGADLSLMKDVSGKTPANLRDEAGLFYDCFEALYRLPVPSICFVHGGVHGGANGIVSACDYTMGDPDTVFSFGEVRLGLVPATVAPFVLQRTGIINAKKLMLGAFDFIGREAQQYGILDILCNRDEADTQISKLTDRILQNAPMALRATKKLLLDMAGNMDFAGLRDLCTELIANTRMSGEAKEGIMAFFEKRNPSWK